MSRPQPKRVSLSAVAKAAGVSAAAVSYALRNRPGVSETMRQEILQVARRLGYTPDARIAALMTQMQGARNKDLLPLAWLNTHFEQDAWSRLKFYSPYLEGARARALELGYRLDEYWTCQPGMTARSLSDTLHQQSVSGAILTQPNRHLRLKWSNFAAVSLEGFLLAPRLHRVQTDRAFNLLLATKILHRHGYRRIGICLDGHFAHNPHQGCLMAADHYLATMPAADRIKPLIYPWEIGSNLPQAPARRAVIQWLRRHRPEVVICHSNRLLDWAHDAGFGVPQDLGVVHLATDDDVSDWAGISSNRRHIGATAVELVISMIHHRNFGVPKMDQTVLIRGTWHNGKTLRIPR